MKDRKWSKPIKGEWASALQSYIKIQAEVVPPEWKKTPDVLRAMGLKYMRGGSRSIMLTEMVENGILEKKQFRIPDISGRRVLPIDHYRLAHKNK
jgi:hypothetical protein